jgi:hypothetical protein
MLPDPTSSATLQSGDLGSLLSYWTPTIIGALIAVLVGAYFYFKSRRVKRLGYIVTTRNLIQNASASLSGIEVRFQGQPADNISVSKISIWNAGTDTVHGTDIAPADPLRFLISDGKLLDAIVARASQPSQFKIGQTVQGLEVSFDYLDKNQGAVVQLVHTGTSDESIQLMGSIKGGCSIVRGPLAPNILLSNIDSVMSFSFSIGLALLVIAFIANGGPLWTLAPNVTILSVLVVVVMVSALVGFGARSLAKRIGAVPRVFES